MDLSLKNCGLTVISPMNLGVVKPPCHRKKKMDGESAVKTKSET